MKLLAVVSALSVLLAVQHGALAAYCHGKPDPKAQPNLNPIFTDAPVFVKSVEHGKLFTVGDGEDRINVVHVWGTPYQWGEAQGQLLQKEAQGLISELWSYLELQVEQGVNGTIRLPEEVLKIIADVGLDGALDLTWEATKKYSGEYFFQEMQGLADAAGVEYKKIRRIHMIGELTKGSCSMYGAWGAATAGGSTLQLRALDWDVDGPFKDFPQITVYHTGNGDQGSDFINIGWTGWVGSITGLNSHRMAISEIGVSFPDDTFGKESRFGVPFTFLLRDILQFDRSLNDSITHLTDAKRTCNLILGVGDGKESAFRGVRYSGSNIAFFDDKNLEPEADWHPRIENVVYYGMDWLCPGYSEVLARQIKAHHGNITAENTIRDIVPITQTGNLHIAVYDLSNSVFYVANARASYETGKAMAYDRTFNRLNATKLFDEPHP
mmetsp:Transcript_13527/g.31136  ORF Transcript_13527/g.31136 Transcript_13527/m.31136 type:complete len:438 (+) Transcript_13527:18-1331(+)|eukprot:CAMPEP_0114556196 /NCGR_PEP_ID=MMETSP0114-20121206/9164_1 /TAXON_ID=31324 /ORGANISM="Goniomonas sp, Strain m" /LENGTH=437 /DNA_ID=CAMNT_0001741393 /DNA_START=14 /DNA_END=1327 /DNA_ORIENTATION=+